MEYQLRYQGRELGVFSLEELRIRREAGELNGVELVWCEGMRDWQTLDSIIRPGIQKKSNRLLVAAIVVGVLVVLFGAIGLEIVVTKFARQVQPIVRQIISSSGTASTKSDWSEESVLNIAGKPIVWNTNTLTALDVQKKAREFRERQYLESYKKFGQRDSPADADSLRLINYWIISNYGASEEKTNLPSLTELNDKLASNPSCDDPLVLTVTAVYSVELHEALRRLERAVAGFQNSKYPGYPKFYATVCLADKLIKDKADRQPVLDASAMQFLKEALKDGSVRPEDQDIIADVLIMGWGQNFFDRNAAALYPIAQGAGKSFEWLALVLEGEFEIQEAWKARGGGYVDTVSEKGWEGFHDHLVKARMCLTAAWKLRPNLPLAADRMIYVSLGDSGIKEMRLWFDRAVAAQIDYAQAWSDFRWGLRPRWYGDLDSMLALGVAAVNTRRFDTDVPREFFDVVSDLESELQLPLGQHIYGREDIWPHLQEMYEGYIAQPQLVESQNGWRATYAAVAYLAGKYDVARTQLEALNWKPNRWNLSGWGTDLSLMPLEVAARTGPLGSQISKAEAAREHGDITTALQLYNNLNKDKNADKRTTAFIQDRLKTLDIERRLQAGEWVNILPSDNNFVGWNIERGKCQSLPDGALEVQSDEDGHILYSRARVGKSFEVKGEIENVRSSTSAFQGGLVIGLPEPDSWGWDAFRIKRNDDEGDLACFAQGWSKNQIYYPIKLNNETNSFYLRFTIDKISASVNGQEIFKEVKPPQNWYLSTNEIYLGLGAFNNMNKTTIRYRNVQIHQLLGN